MMKNPIEIKNETLRVNYSVPTINRNNSTENTTHAVTTPAGTTQRVTIESQPSKKKLTYLEEHEAEKK
jgi:hypothetical protein